MLTAQEKDNITIVWKGMSAILETKNEVEVEHTFAEDFIQHNPWALDGIGHVKEMLQFDFGYRPIRWVADGDIMAYMGYYTAPNPLGGYPLLCVDAWRIEDGKIKEHWDALAPLPQNQVELATAGKGDGEQSTTAYARQSNKTTVRRFMDHVLNRGNLDLIPELVSVDYTYHHHEAGTRTGIALLKENIEQKNKGRMLHETKMIIGSGDLVMSHAHYFGPAERVVFDWFRLDDQNKIVEHWSVEQPITPLEEVANDHPHF